MQRRLVGLRSVALALGLIALVFLPGLGSSHGATPGASAPRPHLPSTIATTDSGGYNLNIFRVGLGTGDVYWVAYDPTGDTLAKVAINDQNASRDGLTNPVATWMANFSVSTYNYSSNWNAYYAIPLSLPFGGQWNVTLSGTHAGFVSYNFSVEVYEDSITTGQSAYLPGTSATLLYEVYKTANDALYTPSSLTLVGSYRLANFSAVSLFAGHGMSITPAGLGSVSFLVPLNAAPNTPIDLRLYANETTASGTVSMSATTYTYVGNLTVSLELTLSTSGNPTSVLPGNVPAILTVDVQIVGGGYYAAAPNISVALTFRGPHNALVSPIPGNPPLSLLTDQNGIASNLFLTSNSTFVPLDTYTIWANATQSGGPGASRNNTIVFSVLPVASNPALALNFGQEMYYGGDTATLTWTLATQGLGSSGGPWTPEAWFAIETASSYRYYATGTVTGSGSSGTFSIGVPSSYQGDLEVVMLAYNATTEIYAYAYAYVSHPSILLAPSEYDYLPGDTISVGVSTQGSALSSATLYWTAGGYDGSFPTFATGTVSGGSFSFMAPALASIGDIQVNVTAESASSGVLASDSVLIYTGNHYDLQAGIQTASNYADGSYQPGQTVQIHYSIVPLVKSAPAPGVFTLYLETDHYVPNGGSMLFQTTATSGSFSFKIPSSWGTGTQYLYLYAEFQNCPTGSCYAESDFAIPVESSPSALSYELGAGSGLTVGWLILLVVILVVALLLVLLIRRRPPSSAASPLQPYSGTTSAGAGSSPPSWSEGTGTPKSDPGASNPPLPTPPPSPPS